MKIEIKDLENVKNLPDSQKATGISKKKEKAEIAKKISAIKKKVVPKKVIPIVEIAPKPKKIASKVKKVVAKVTKPAKVKAKVVAKVKKVIAKKK